MQHEDITITNPVGLHARPASIFVQTSNKFKSEIQVEYDAKTANAKSILQVLSLGVKKGGKISLKISGTDEVQAITTLKKLIVEDFEDLE
jgi:phosphocarrier protein HPr